MLRSLLLLVALLLQAAPAVAQERRVALVIGNGAYAHAARLANPVNDAEGMERTLRGMGFAVTLARNLDGAGMRRALRDFGDAARGADVALMFFAGHGMQMGQRERSENFLVPVDARLADARDLEDEAIRLSRVLELMEEAKARIVILDACRDNPLIARMANAAGTRSVSRGLAPLEQAGQGTLVAFSTAPGAVAADGRGANSPFTEALMRHLPTRGAELRAVFTRVRADVARATGNGQTPWTNDGLLRELFLAGAEAPTPPVPGPPGPPPAVPSEALELVFWQSVQASLTIANLEEYLRRFPNGVFSGLARIRLADLQRAAAEAARREEEERRRLEAERIRQAQEEAERRRQEADRLRREQEEAERRRQEAERRRREEEDRRRREEEDRRARPFDTGDLTALAGCWRTGNWSDASGYAELCFRGAAGVTYSYDVRFNNGTVTTCLPHPGARLAASGGGSFTVEAPQTSGTPCRDARGATDFGRERLICRAVAGRSDQLSCERSAFDWNSSRILGTDRDTYTRR